MFSSIRQSISRKFMVAVMATTFTAVFVSGMANLAYDIHDFRTSVLEELSSQGDILAKVSTAALEFEDKPSAETTLGRLAARPNVHAAAIYRADGSLFVAHAGSGQSQALSPPSRPSSAGHIIDGNDLHIFRPILRGLKMFGVALAVSLAVAALVALWLQSAVSMPVKAMTRAVRELITRRARWNSRKPTSSCTSGKRWKPSASSPAAWRTTSTTSCKSSAATCSCWP